MVNVLARKAVLAQLSISRWGARRFQDDVAAEVVHKAKAKDGAAVVTKRLLPKEAMSRIHSIAGQARVLHAQLTLPWLDDGVRILPTEMYLNYTQQIGKLKKEFEQAVADFIAGYPEFVKEAQADLGDLFDPGDYPDATQVKLRFSFGITILPCPDKDDFRASLDPSVLDEIKSDMDQLMTKQIKSAVNDAAERVLAVVGHMVERLKAYKPANKAKKKKAEGKFNDSLVEHVRELAELLPAFNLMGDPRLNKIHKQIIDNLCGYDADALRSDPEVRKQVRVSAEKIVADVRDFMA